jgi:hypothetical protein
MVGHVELLASIRREVADREADLTALLVIAAAVVGHFVVGVELAHGEAVYPACRCE